MAKKKATKKPPAKSLVNESWISSAFNKNPNQSPKAGSEGKDFQHMPLIHDPNQKPDPNAVRHMPLIPDPNPKPLVNPDSVQMMEEGKLQRQVIRKKSGNDMLQGIADKVTGKLRDFFEPGLAHTGMNAALEASNKAQQEPTIQQMDINDSRRGLEAEDAANDRARRDLEFKREMNPNQNQEDLDALQSRVVRERQSEIFSPSDLLPAGRAEFDAAARGEIPGYAIKDPGARAAFSRARQSDPGFGSRERVNAEREPIPFDQELMDDLEFEGQQRRNDLEDKGLDPVIDARIRAYEEAKKNGRLSLYDAKTIGKFERAIKRRDGGDYSFEDEFEGESMNSGDGDFDYDAMGKRAQKGQQPRSAGGIGQGPLTNVRSKAEEERIDGVMEKRWFAFHEAIYDADDDAKFVEVNGKKYKIERAKEILDNIGLYERRRETGDDRLSYRPGRQFRNHTDWDSGMPGDIHAKGRLASDLGHHRKQNDPRSDESWSGERFQNQPRRGGGGGGGFTPGRTPAYNDAPLSASMQDPVTPDGKGYTLSDGTIMPDPDGMSEADFAGAVADNPVPAAEAFEYATENGTMTQKQRDTYNKLRQSRPDDLRSDQIETFNRNRKVEMGRLAADVFRANKAHAEQARSKAAREAKTARNESRTRMNRLERIYRQHLDKDTKGKVNAFGELSGAYADDETLQGKMTEALTKEQFEAAAQWEADQEAAFNAMQEKNAGAVAAIQQGEAPAPSDEAHWEFVSQDIGFGDQVYAAQSTPTGDKYGVIVEDGQVFLRLPEDEWENVSEEDRMAVAGIILPPEGTDGLTWLDHTNQIPAGVGGEKIMANPDGTLATEQAATEEAATEEEKVNFDGSAGRVIQSLPEAF